MKNTDSVSKWGVGGYCVAFPPYLHLACDGIYIANQPSSIIFYQFLTTIQVFAYYSVTLLNFGRIINNMLNNQYIFYVDVSLILYADNRCAKELGHGISLYLANNNNSIYLPTGFWMNALDHNMLREDSHLESGDLVRSSHSMQTN